LPPNRPGRNQLGIHQGEQSMRYLRTPLNCVFPVSGLAEALREIRACKGTSGAGSDLCIPGRAESGEGTRAEGTRNAAGNVCIRSPGVSNRGGQLQRAALDADNSRVPPWNSGLPTQRGGC
jgi:hypothetical protein